MAFLQYHPASEMCNCNTPDLSFAIGPSDVGVAAAAVLCHESPETKYEHTQYRTKKRTMCTISHLLSPFEYFGNSNKLERIP